MAKKRPVIHRSRIHENKDSLELRFLIEQHFKEVAHFWTRTNVFLVTNVAAIGGILTIRSAEHSFGPMTVVVVSFIGILFCIIWFYVNRVTVYYEKRWLADARRLAQSKSYLKSVFFLSLGFREMRDHTIEKKDWFGNSFFDIRRPAGYSATNLMYILIGLFGFGWILLFLSGLFLLYQN